MKRTVHTILCLLLGLSCLALSSCGLLGRDESAPFITRWKGTKGEKIQVPLYGRYTYTWEKADGTLVKTEEIALPRHTLLELDVDTDGEFLLKVYTDVLHLEFGLVVGEEFHGQRGTPEALLQVEQWGTARWPTFAGAFSGCSNMNISEHADLPNLLGVKSMNFAFAGCASFNSSLAMWDVSRVMTMRGTFYQCNSFNQPLEKWDVSRVTDMAAMFADCYLFNQPLERWNVSNVKVMRAMFDNCRSFNQPLEKWDVSNVTDMMHMFKGCATFNQSLEKWDVSNVTNMYNMFSHCLAFDQPLEKWNVSNVTDMSRMFCGSASFNQPLAKWDVSKVTDMEYMFYECRAFNQPLERWDVSKVTKMSFMFYGCSAFNQPLGGWVFSAPKRHDQMIWLDLSNSGMSVHNYSSTLVEWAAKINRMPPRWHVEAKGLKYNAAAKAARKKLVEERQWEFSGDAEANW